MIETDKFAQIEIDAAPQLHQWLADHHAQKESVWLVTHKRGAGEKYVSREEALDALIAYGWIDGIRRKRDDGKTMQLISPRKHQRWAKSYKDRAARLEAEGIMKEPGRAAIASAKQSGLWSELDHVDQLATPSDLDAALLTKPPAKDYWQDFAPSYRRNVLRWIAIAVKPETRAARVEKVALLTSLNQKVPQF
jgi:uncharacterized protein YdeI (YjbR/CyaY-like superfamily)